MQEATIGVSLARQLKGAELKTWIGLQAMGGTATLDQMVEDLCLARKTIRLAAHRLEDLGLLRSEPLREGRSGRPSFIYHVSVMNPRLKP